MKAGFHACNKRIIKRLGSLLNENPKRRIGDQWRYSKEELVNIRESKKGEVVQK